jgi:hypothetical protein
VAVGTRPAAAIVGTPNSANGTSVAIPTHAVGQLIVLFIRGASSLPTKPTASGTVPAWVDIDSESGGSWAACRTVQFKASATNHTTGTWTNADGIIAVVIEDQHTSSPIGGHAASVTPVDSPTNQCVAPSITQVQTDGKALLLHFFGWGNGTPGNCTAIAAAPAGYTQRLTRVYAGTEGGVALDTKNSSTSDGAVTQTSTSNGYYRGATVEIKSS